MISLAPTRFFKCLGDDTRLLLTLLIHSEGELCVCELTHALKESQPKISRHLAQLRACGLLKDRREGQWVYYDLVPSLPGWARCALKAAAAGDADRLLARQRRLAEMGNRPERRVAMC